MSLESLINGTNANDQGSGGFTSRSSLLTFSGASAVVTLMYMFFGQIVGSLLTSDPARAVFALVCAAPVGYYLFTRSIRTSTSQAKRREGAFIAFINTVILASAALGLTAASTGNTPVPQLPGQSLAKAPIVSPAPGPTP